MIRAVGIVAVVVLVVGVMWREAVAVGVARASDGQRRRVGLVLVVAAVTFVGSAATTVAGML